MYVIKVHFLKFVKEMSEATDARVNDHRSMILDNATTTKIKEFFVVEISHHTVTKSTHPNMRVLFRYWDYFYCTALGMRR